MPNYIVSYDLNGSTPSHAQMDNHIRQNTNWLFGRVLETVWYIRTEQSADEVYDHFDAILSNNDRLLVVEGTQAVFRNLLIRSDALKQAWES